MTNEDLHTRGAPIRFILLLAAWLGLVSGLVEGMLLLFLQEVRWMSFEDLIFASVGSQQIWISGLFNLVMFSGLGLLMAVAMWVEPWKWKRWPEAGLFVFGFLLFWGWVDSTGRMRFYASGTLALGLTVQFTRLMQGRLDGFASWMRRTLPALVAATIVLTAVLAGYARISEMRIHAALPTSKRGSPNVLLIVLDTVRADHLSSYGYPRPTTPFLDQVGREGVLFERAYATSSWTLPSHVSMFTGMYPSEHGATKIGTFEAVDEHLPVLAEALHQKGYVTAGFVSNTYYLMPWLGVSRGFSHYENLYETWPGYAGRTFYGRRIRSWRGRQSHPKLVDMPHRPVRAICQSFLKWLDRQPPRPFFAFLNLMEAHSPFRFPLGYKKQFRGAPAVSAGQDPEKIWPAPKGKTVGDHAQFIEDYDNSIAVMDAELKVLFDELANRGLTENTLVIVTSDHGEQFGEHGLKLHMSSLYQPLIRVPMMLRWPGQVPAGRKLEEPVTQRDLAATIMDLVDPGAKPSFGGRSWRRTWESGGVSDGEPEAILTELDIANFPRLTEHWPNRAGWLKAVIQGDWKLIQHQQGKVEVYDLAKDPLEAKDLASMPEGKPVVENLRKELAKLLKTRH